MRDGVPRKIGVWGGSRDCGGKKGNSQEGMLGIHLITISISAEHVVWDVPHWRVRMLRRTTMAKEQEVGDLRGGRGKGNQRGRVRRKGRDEEECEDKMASRRRHG